MNTVATLWLWNRIPWDDLPESAKVDFSLFLLNLKPTVRFLTESGFSPKDLQLVMNSYHFDFVNEAIYIAKNENDLSALVISDNRCVPHEQELGSLLGYPPCCCKKIELVGESFIDMYAEQFIKTVEKRSLLDISCYKKGISLVSHIPCSPDCEPSLKIARLLLNFIRTAAGYEEPFELWRKRLLTYYYKEFNKTNTLSPNTSNN